MKTQKLLFLWLLCCSTIPVFAQQGERFITINGKILNETTKKAVEYANVRAVGTNIGTVCNEDGEFSLKIVDTLKVTEIEFSSLGFANKRLPLSDFFQNKSQSDVVTSGINASKIFKIIRLSPRTVVLSEVEVLGWENPQKLVETAIDRIEKNYPSSPALLTGFYRETVQKGKRYIDISEAVLSVYKNSYESFYRTEKVQVLKGRRLVSPNLRDTLAVKLLGGPTSATSLDFVKNREIIFTKEDLQFYSFKMEGTATIDNRVQLMVSFSPKVQAENPLFSGTLYIDRETLAFSRIECSIQMTDKQKVTELVLRKKPLGLRFSPNEMNYTVSYRQIDGKFQLNYIRFELKFRCDWRRRLFATNYVVVSEFVATNSQTDNVEKIPGKSAFSSGKSLADEVSDYFDSDFWGAYNIIEPTESLERAVKFLKKK